MHGRTISIFIFLSQIYRGYLQVLSNCIALIVRKGGGSTFEIETQCATFKGWKLDPHVAHSCPKCFGGLGKLWIVRKFRFLCFEVQVCLYDMIVSLGAISNQSLERSKLYPVSGADWRSIACTASRANTHCCVFTKTRKYQKNARLRVHRY